jgi:hypothetical protein
MPTSHSYQVSKDLYLVRHTLDQASNAPPKAVEIPTNHFAVIDCSGSMSYDLPKIREQLKRKLPKLLKETDTMTIIWFSGRGQFGTLLEAEPVATLKDLKAVEAAIDRWLRPQGLTGFKEPLEEAAKVVERVNKKSAGSVSSLFFMSDGCDNQWARADVLKTMEKASGGFASTTIVEYGYYADRPLLSAMAEKAGGAHIFAEDFVRYEPAFEAAIQKKQSGAPRIEVAVAGEPIGNFVYALTDGDLITYAIESGKVAVPKDLDAFWFLSPSVVGSKHDRDVTQHAKTYAENIAPFTTKPGEVLGDTLRAAYAAVSLFAVRMKSNIVFPLLKALGDVTLIERFATCFGKQKYSEFQELAQKASNAEGCFTKGYDPNKVPRDDAFTVLDVLKLLASDDANRVLLDHPDFKYSRIGRGRIDASDQLTTAEQEEIKLLTLKLATEKNATKVREISDKISALTANKAPALQFKAASAPEGYPISSLTFNEDRPNVSFLVRKLGTVDLTSRSGPASIPTQFETFIFRNYAVVKDGLVNIDKLPVSVARSTYEKLKTELGEFHPVIETGGNLPNDKFEILLDLRSLPVINRKMVKDVSAKKFFETQYALAISQAEQKVYNAYSKELLPAKKSEGFAAQYGDDGATWLKDQGFTDYSGFSPKSVQADATDFYMGKELKVSLKGLSKLPSLKEVKEQMGKNKVNAGGALMVPTVRLVESFLASDIYAKAAEKDKVLEAWLAGQTKAAKAKTRDLIFQIAQTTFSLVVGQVWFNEFSSLDENSMSITVNGAPLECKAEMHEIEIKI